MHQIGRKQWLTAVSDASEAKQELACNTNYDFDLQEAKLLPTPFDLKPGNALTLDCVYDSTSRTTLTHGGDESE